MDNQEQGNAILQFRNVTKRYPGVLALDHVSLAIRKGEVHAIVGENGAGKSTLIKTCSGAIRPTSGSIFIDGKEFLGLTPALARQHGVSVIYQEFNLVNEMTVYDNIFLGEHLSEKRLTVDKKQMMREAEKIFSQLDIQISPSSYVRDLSVGFQQMVEIAKAVAKKAKILIMDEPSAPLTTKEVETMFDLIRRLKSSGISIIYISHRLDEIFSVCDRVSILRDGKYIATKQVAETTREELITYMVGRKLDESIMERREDRSGKVGLELKNVSGNGVKNVNMRAYKGEILGIGGLIGAGRTELAQLLFGAKKMTGGQILIDGQEYRPKSPKAAIRHGLVLAPEDRKGQGLVLSLSIRENISLPSLPALSKKGYINRKKEKELAKKLCAELRIKTASLTQETSSLSGGNQQKIVIAKWLAKEPSIIIFDEPTRGIDVGAKQEIYKMLRNLANQGKIVIMISSDMEELLSVSDRIQVMCEGRMTGEIRDRANFTQENVLTFASVTTEN